MTPKGIQLRVESLHKGFPGVKAVDGVSAVFEPGRVHALLGANGAGKSTVMNIIAGRLTPDAGTLSLDGAEVEFSGPLDAQKLGIELIPQELTLVREFTAAENIVLGAYPRRLSRVRWRAVRKRAAELAAVLGITAPLDAPVRSIPAVDQRLVMVARALHREGSIVMMDEPTAALPHSQAERLFSVIDDLKRQGLTIIYCSHRLEEVVAMCDDVTVMTEGRVVMSRPVTGLTKEELVTAIMGRATRVSVSPSAAASRADVVVEVSGLSGRKIQNASFQLHRGEILGVAGLVGSGSSELTRLLFGSQQKSAGTVLVHGKELRIRGPRDAIRAGIGLLPQDRRQHGSIGDLPISVNLTLATPRKGSRGVVLDRRRERKLASEVLARYEIRRDDVEQPLRSLSGGNQQRVLMAKWLLTGASVLVLDEPTVGVDVGARALIHQMLRKMTGDGGAILVASSDFEELALIADRVLVLREGWIVGELTRPGITAEALVRNCYADLPVAA